MRSELQLEAWRTLVNIYYAEIWENLSVHHFMPFLPLPYTSLFTHLTFVFLTPIVFSRSCCFSLFLPLCSFTSQIEFLTLQKANVTPKCQLSRVCDATNENEVVSTLITEINYKKGSQWWTAEDRKHDEMHHMMHCTMCNGKKGQIFCLSKLEIIYLYFYLILSKAIQSNIIWPKLSTVIFSWVKMTILYLFNINGNN